MSTFLDPILGIRMILLRLRLQLNYNLLKQLAVVESKIIHPFNENCLKLLRYWSVFHVLPVLVDKFLVGSYDI